MTSPTLRRTSFCLLPLLLVLLAAAPARGQMSNALPEAITSRELSDYGERLGLSAQQRLALEPFHAEYRDAWDQLHATEIEPFLERASSIGSNWFALARDPKLLDDVIRDYSRLVDRIAALDRRLLDQVQTVLGEEQSMQLERVRDARRRARCGSGMNRMVSFANRSATADLSDLVRRLQLAPEQAEAADPVVRRYEQTLTVELCRQHDEAMGMVRDAFAQMAALQAAAAQAAAEAAEAAQAGEEGQPDPQRMRRMFEEMRNAWSSLMTRMVERSMEISDLNRRTLSSVMAVLPADVAHDLHERYYSEAYSEFTTKMLDADRRFDLALELEELSSEQRTAVLDLRSAYYRDIHAVSREAADAIDGHRRERRFMRDDDTEAEQRYEQAMTDLRSRRQRRNEEAVAALDALLGEELAGRIEHGRPDEPQKQVAFGGSVTIAATGDGGAVTSFSMEIEGDLPGSEAELLPSPINASELAEYGDWLGFDQMHSEIAAALHMDYMNAYEELRRARTQEIQQSRQELWALDEHSGRLVPPAEELIERIYGARRSAIEALQGQDALLIDDLAALLPEEQRPRAERVRLARQRDVYRSAMAAASMGRDDELVGLQNLTSQSQEHSIDLVRLLDEIDVTGADPARLGPALASYERAVTDRFRRAWESATTFAEELEKTQAANARGDQQQDADRRERMQRRWSVIREEGQAAAQAMGDVVEQNRASLQELAAVLPEAPATELTDAYHRAAFPDIFDDERSALKSLDAALELESLSWEQRSTLADVGSRFRTDYRACLGRMVQVQMEGSGAESLFSGDWRERMERQRRLEELTEERSDLNEQIRVRLRAVLSDEQARAVGLGEEG